MAYTVKDLAPHVVKYYTIQWFMGDDGMINQTLEDLQDWETSTFTETAKAHNQKLYTEGSSDALV